MKQVVRRVIDRKGKVTTLELPEPFCGADQVLVQNHFSLISSGTELGTLAKTPTELIRQSLRDPWLRRMVSQMVFAAGPIDTARRVWHEMLLPREIGYSGAGRVLAVGDRIEGFKVGDKVAYAATGHAEIAAPAVNHLVAVPEEVDLRHAAFVTVGAIALHALRRAEVQIGERVAVYGLGLVGQVAAMLAKAAGCVVLGIDVDPERTRLAGELGADLVVQAGEDDLPRRVGDFTGKHGVDATIVCASSRSASVINSAMELTRRQGRVVLVGYVKLDIDPKGFLYREIDLRYSRAYGPGSYHRAYEKGRVDYPFGYVRWTEQRNLQEVIRLIGTGALRLEPLIGRAFPIADAQAAFDAIADRSLGGVAALLDYGVAAPDRRRSLPVRPRSKAKGKLGLAVVGVGNHFLAALLPALRARRDVELRSLVSATGKHAAMIAESLAVTEITSDLDAALADPELDAVLVCSGHPQHAEHLRKAIAAGKPIFVEKPLVSRLDDLRTILGLMVDRPTLLTVGLNRRYSPLVGRLRSWLRGPVDSVKYLVCPPSVPADHWTLDEVDGGGRLVAEGEHFIDLCHLLIGKEPLAVSARALGDEPDDLRRLCNWALTIHYPGAEANVTFDESGAPGFPREQVTVLGRGQVAVLDDFALLRCFGPGGSSTVGSRRRKQMGHAAGLDQLFLALRGEPNALLTWEEAKRAALTLFAAQESLRTGTTIDLRRFAEGLLTPAPERTE